MTLAALVGPEFDVAKLGVISGMELDDLQNRIYEAERARLLVKTKGGELRFLHLLVPDAIRKKLSRRERALRHSVIAERLLAHHGSLSSLHAPELVDHLWRALPGGDPSRLVRLAMAGADVQASRGNHAAAMRLWERAADALDHFGAGDGLRLAVQLGLSHAQARAGATAQARLSFHDALVLARVFERADALAEAALGLASVVGAHDAEARVSLEEARAAVRAAASDEAKELLERIEGALRESERGAAPGSSRTAPARPKEDDNP
jgi:hypothetical protein